RVRRLRELATLERSGDKPLIEDERFRAKIAAVEVELKALEMTQLRVVAAERNRRDKKPDPASSILKIKGTEIQQTITELLVEVDRAKRDRVGESRRESEVGSVLRPSPGRGG